VDRRFPGDRPPRPSAVIHGAHVPRSQAAGQIRHQLELDGLSNLELLEARTVNVPGFEADLGAPILEPYQTPAPAILG
jgi:hypothetical protein